MSTSPALISDKFRIFNAEQFLESIGEVGDELYFFVGRSTPWYTFVEVSDKEGTFAVGDTISGGGWSAELVVENTTNLIVQNVVDPGVAPAAGTVLTATSGGTATALTYRYATDELPPKAIDNLEESYDVYDQIIAAKKIDSSYARAVVRRWNWNTILNPEFDMWKPDYFADNSPSVLGRSNSTGSGKYYVMNNEYEVFLCLYNGENATQTAATASEEPSTNGGNYNAADGTYTGADGYIWKYAYTISTNDVLKFLSSDFLPVSAYTGPAVVDGAVEVVVDQGVGGVASTITFGSDIGQTTVYAPIRGDGSGAVAEITLSASTGTATITGVHTNSALGSNNGLKGTGYTFGTIALENGAGAAGFESGLYTDNTLATPIAAVTGANNGLVAIISPKGGHGADLNEQLNAKRIMTNIRLTYDEGAGDFPVDNDFRRIGLIKNPTVANSGSAPLADEQTVTGLTTLAIARSGASAALTFNVDTEIQQVTADGVARGTVVSAVIDSNDSTRIFVKLYQSPKEHLSNGYLIPFVSATTPGAGDVTNPVALGGSGIGAAAGTAVVEDLTGDYAVDEQGAGPDGLDDVGIAFTNGLSSPEITRGSGEIIYYENRRLITRASDQIEDIKLVIEF